MSSATFATSFHVSALDNPEYAASYVLPGDCSDAKAFSKFLAVFNVEGKRHWSELHAATNSKATVKDFARPQHNRYPKTPHWYVSIHTHDLPRVDTPNAPTLLVTTFRILENSDGVETGTYTMLGDVNADPSICDRLLEIFNADEKAIAEEDGIGEPFEAYATWEDLCKSYDVDMNVLPLLV